MNKILYTFYCFTLLTTNNLQVSGSTRPFLNTYVPEGGAPYVVYVRSIIDGKEKKCTGTILDKNWVLTIASCVPLDEKKANITVVANMNFYEESGDSDSDSQIRSIKYAIVHPKYKPNKVGQADLALLKVEIPFEENEMVNSIGIDGDGWPLDNGKPMKRMCTVYGYGDIDYTKRDNKLKSRRVQITHSDSCACTRRNEWMQLACCDSVEDVGLCPEDDGAPLVCKEKIVGVNHILLVKSNCSPPILPQDICGDYSVVSYFMYLCPYLSWIKESIVTLPTFTTHCNVSPSIQQYAYSNKLLLLWILWAVLILIASVGLSAVSYNSWHNFQHPAIMKTVLTTRNDCSNLPFPSFTVCDTSRVDWHKALKLTSRDIPNLGNGSKEKVLLLLQTLADITFGDFDFLETMSLANFTSSGLGKLDITNLLQKVQRPCSEVFVSCWWREDYVNCCTLFEVQRTDIGFCYSFNSDLSDVSESFSRGYGLSKESENYWIDWNNVIRPRRAVTSGPWNGLRVIVSAMTPEQLPPDTNITSGVMFYLEESRSFPNSENQHVNPASFVDVRVYGITLQAQPDVRSLDFVDRLCLFPDERRGWNGVYKECEQNCYAACQREYTMKLCNCSPTFLFIDDDIKYPACDLKGLFCLKDNNYVFNTMAPNEGQEVFFNDLGNAMKCDCPPDCTSQHYMFDTSISQILDPFHILFDVHYRGQNYNIVYTSDVSFDAMDFIVSIGGVAGLFLGGSIISGVELIYFFTVRFFYHWKRARKVEDLPQNTSKHVYPYLY